MNTDVTDIDPKEALEETKQSDEPQQKAAPAKVEREEVDVIDTLQPKAEPKVWKFEDGDIDREYIQRPLSYFGKMNFFALVGEVIDKAVSGNQGLKISSLFEAPEGRDGILSASDFRDADTFIQGVGKLLSYAPDFLEKSYCIWLNIPDHEQKWAISVMNKPAEQGGLSDDDGVEIIEIFIDQNWESLESFFREKIASLRDRVQSHRQTDSETEETTDE